VILQALPREGAVLALETARSAGLVAIAPMLGLDAPMRVRAAFVVLLAIIAHGSAAAAPPGVEQLSALVLAVPSELFIGAAMGFVVRCALAVVEVAGDLASPLLGFGAASLFDPHTAAQETALTRMLRLLAMLLGFLLGLHRVVIGSLLASYRMLPPGAVIDAPRAALPLIALTAQVLEAGVRLALPVVCVLVLVQVALAFVSRAAPAMQIFSVGFAFSLVAGGLALIIALPDVAREILVQLSLVGRRIELVLGAVAT
jgi:flagellar biosynthesis protein FliR